MLKKNLFIITGTLIASLFCLNAFAEEFDLKVPLKGSSIANKELQLEALPAVYAAASAKSPACKEFSIEDTKVTQEPADLKMEDDEYIGGNWEEAWSVQYCGMNMLVPIKFTITKDKTTFNVKTEF